MLSFGCYKKTCTNSLRVHLTDEFFSAEENVLLVPRSTFQKGKTQVANHQ